MARNTGEPSTELTTVTFRQILDDTQQVLRVNRFWKVDLEACRQGLLLVLMLNECSQGNRR